MSPDLLNANITNALVGWNWNQSKF